MEIKCYTMRLAVVLLIVYVGAGLQAQSADDDKVYTVVEQMPEYPGGESALLKYLSSVQYPAISKDSDITGAATVRFVIDKDGSVIDIETQSEDIPLKSALTEHVKQMPKWKPGKQDGEFVKVKYVVPIRICFLQ